MVTERDIVLIYSEGTPLTFARIEEILPDIKPNWYHVKLLILQIPLHPVTWILRDSYINGEEFTMDGRKVRLELIECPEIAEKPDVHEEKGRISRGSKKGKLILLKNRKKV
ncbi:MAG: hypothetical protein L6247_05500 [Desulfobacteraceae bacterium]|nr:hypothetical protein [Pseudomonadota bacterium]MBU4463280.1 hypothetical protein [Pseudomonadota bacterium]MCG2755003.1 hypothetical protein [Desulfobacteraceae bacterium]